MTEAEELARWRALGRYALAQRFDDLCWLDLYKGAADVLGVPFDPALLPKPLMMANCSRYVDSLRSACPYRTPPSLPAVEAVFDGYHKLFGLLSAATEAQYDDMTRLIRAAEAEMRAAGLTLVADRKEDP